VIWLPNLGPCNNTNDRAGQRARLDAQTGSLSYGNITRRLGCLQLRNPPRLRPWRLLFHGQSSIMFIRERRQVPCSSCLCPAHHLFNSVPRNSFNMRAILSQFVATIMLALRPFRCGSMRVLLSEFVTRESQERSRSTITAFEMNGLSESAPYPYSYP
jgi:hypothetical protein